MNRSREGVVIVDASDGVALNVLAGGGSARAVIWPGMGARLRSMHRISLDPGSRTIELRHPSEAVYYVVSGGGAATDSDEGSQQDLIERSMLHVDAGTAYTLAGGPDGIELIGGPCPADPSLYPDNTSGGPG